MQPAQKLFELSPMVIPSADNPSAQPEQSSSPTWRTGQRIGGQYSQFRLAVIWLALSCIVHTGCAVYSHKQHVERGLLTEEVVSTPLFRHRLFHNRSDFDSGPLHIYIEGDGSPWQRRDLVAVDPTSPDPLLLGAMLSDPAPSVYLGRPCYYQTDDPACNGLWWTLNRYHPRIVESMRQVVERLAKHKRELWLIGHSGGGSLAVLIGRRLARPVNVVTVAGNLDHEAWTTHHHYSPLTGSLNPAKDQALNPQMNELHWYGADDRTILPAWAKAYCRRLAVSCKEAQAEHTRGWLDNWEHILAESQAAFAPRGAQE